MADEENIGRVELDLSLNTSLYQKQLDAAEKRLFGVFEGSNKQVRGIFSAAGHAAFVEFEKINKKIMRGNLKEYQQRRKMQPSPDIMFERLERRGVKARAGLDPGFSLHPRRYEKQLQDEFIRHREMVKQSLTNNDKEQARRRAGLSRKALTQLREARKYKATDSLDLAIIKYNEQATREGKALVKRRAEVTDIEQWLKDPKVRQLAVTGEHRRVYATKALHTYYALRDKYEKQAEKQGIKFDPNIMEERDLRLYEWATRSVRRFDLERGIQPKIPPFISADQIQEVEKVSQLAGKTLSFLDVETTGFKDSDRIIEVAITKVDEFGNVIDKFIQRIDPKMPIPKDASAVNKIYDKDVKGQPVFSDVAQKIQEMLKGTIMVAHNASFDERMLRSEFSKLGLELPIEGIVDTLKLAQVALPNIPSHAQGELAKHFGVDPGQAHTAGDDVETLFGIWQKLIPLVQQYVGQLRQASVETNKIKESTEQTEVAIVGCGRRKVWTPDSYPESQVPEGIPEFVKAKDAYLSERFKVARAEAETAQKWMILSGKFGLLDPEAPIGDYNVQITDPQAIKPEDLAQQIKQAGLVGKDIKLLGIDDTYREIFEKAQQIAAQSKEATSGITQGLREAIQPLISAISGLTEMLARVLPGIRASLPVKATTTTSSTSTRRGEASSSVFKSQEQEKAEQEKAAEREQREVNRINRLERQRKRVEKLQRDAERLNKILLNPNTETDEIDTIVTQMFATSVGLGDELGKHTENLARRSSTGQKGAEKLLDPIRSFLKALHSEGSFDNVRKELEGLGYNVQNITDNVIKETRKAIPKNEIDLLAGSKSQDMGKDTLTQRWGTLKWISTIPTTGPQQVSEAQVKLWQYIEALRLKAFDDILKVTDSTAAKPDLTQKLDTSARLERMGQAVPEQPKVQQESQSAEKLQQEIQEETQQVVQDTEKLQRGLHGVRKTIISAWSRLAHLSKKEVSNVAGPPKYEPRFLSAIEKAIDGDLKGLEDYLTEIQTTQRQGKTVQDPYVGYQRIGYSGPETRELLTSVADFYKEHERINELQKSYVDKGEKPPEGIKDELTKARDTLYQELRQFAAWYKKAIGEAAPDLGLLTEILGPVATQYREMERAARGAIAAGQKGSIVEGSAENILTRDRHTQEIARKNRREIQEYIAYRLNARLPEAERPFVSAREQDDFVKGIIQDLEYTEKHRDTEGYAPRARRPEEIQRFLKVWGKTSKKHIGGFETLEDILDYEKTIERIDSKVSKKVVGWEKYFKSATRIASGILISQAFYTGLRFIRQLRQQTIKFADDFQRARITFAALTGNFRRGTEYLRQMSNAASDIPVAMEKVWDVGKRLTAVGFGKNVIPMISTIADATAAIGGGDQMFESIAMAFSRMKALNRVTVRELRPFVHAGIDISSIIKESFGISIKGLLEAVRTGAVKTGDIIEALTMGMEKRFKGLAEMVETSTIGGLTRSIGKNISLIIKDFVDAPYQGTMQWLQKIRLLAIRTKDEVQEHGPGGLIDLSFSPATAAAIRMIIAGFMSLGSTLKSVGDVIGPIIGRIFGALTHALATMLGVISIVLTKIRQFIVWLTGLGTQMPWLATTVNRLTQAFIGLTIVATLTRLFSFFGRIIAGLISLKTTFSIVTLGATGATTAFGKALLWVNTIAMTNPLGALLIAVSTIITLIVVATGLWNKFMKSVYNTTASFSGIDLSNILRVGPIQDATEAMADLSGWYKEAEEGAKAAEDAQKKWLASFDEVYQAPDQLDELGLLYSDMADAIPQASQLGIEQTRLDIRKLNEEIAEVMKNIDDQINTGSFQLPEPKQSEWSKFWSNWWEDAKVVFGAAKDWIQNTWLYKWLAGSVLWGWLGDFWRWFKELVRIAFFDTEQLVKDFELILETVKQWWQGTWLYDKLIELKNALINIGIHVRDIWIAASGKVNAWWQGFKQDAAFIAAVVKDIWIAALGRVNNWWTQLKEDVKEAYEWFIRLMKAKEGPGYQEPTFSERYEQTHGYDPDTGLKSDQEIQAGVIVPKIRVVSPTETSATQETIEDIIKELFEPIPMMASGGVSLRDQVVRVSEGRVKEEAIIPLSEDALRPFARVMAEQMGAQGVNQSSGLPVVYVHTLIADERGLRELERRMHMIRVNEGMRRGA